MAYIAWPTMYVRTLNVKACLAAPKLLVLFVLEVASNYTCPAFKHALSMLCSKVACTFAVAQQSMHTAAALQGEVP